MTEVKLHLYDSKEMDLFAAFARDLEALRQAQYASSCENEAPPAPAGETAARDLVSSVSGGVSPDVRHDLTPPIPETAPVDTPEAAPLTTRQMEDAVRTFAHKQGFEKARALLDEYGAPKIGDVPAEKRAEVYVRLTA